MLSHTLRMGTTGFAPGERLRVSAFNHNEIGSTGEVFDAKTGETAFDFIPCDAVGLTSTDAPWRKYALY